MAIAVAETVIGTAASAASILLASWSPAAGDVILLAVETRQTTVTHTSVSGHGLTWTKLVELNAGASTNIRASLWWARAATAPGAGQISVTLSGAPATALAVACRFSGVDATIPVEASASNGNASSATPSVAVTILTANAWMVAAMMDRSSTFTAGASMSLISNNTTGTSGNTLRVALERQEVPTPGAVTADGTWSAAVTWIAIAAVLKPAAGGAPPGGRAIRSVQSGAVVMVSGG